ncbi:MAG TPA: hypothetical protein VMF66_11600 [Candidatus Acidoferrum sp.]|nr:hypothetical protein [Candidatus Acidoferrum sp.]
MRANPALSLSHAAKLEGVKPATVLKYFSSALSKTGRTFRASPSDRYAAVLHVPNAEGKAVSVRTHSSKDREMLGQYLRDLGRYMRGDADALTRWRGKKVAGFELVTDEAAIIGMESVLSDFSLYQSVQ